MTKRNDDVGAMARVTELDVRETELVSGGFNWEAAVFCAGCAVEFGPAGMLIAGIAGGIACS